MFAIYFVTVIVFVALDAMVRPVIARNRAQTILPAAMFYLAYVAGLVWLVSMPALMAGRPLEAALKGGVVGAMAYSTRNLTPGSRKRAMIDTLWGATLSGLAAGIGVAATLWIG